MAQEDLLGREEFVSMIETIISNKVENLAGCSLAIDGKWGCGKSFILKMLESNLRGRGYFVVHYNCWQNDYYEEPLVAILSVFVDALNSLKSESIQDEQKKRTKELAKTFFKNLAFMIAKNKLGVDFNELGVSLEELKNNVSNVLDKDKAALFDKNFDPNLLLKQSVETIHQFLLKIKLEWKAVVLVVDELDRCSPEYAIKVLERLHHICYDTEYDLFQFVQLAAINRAELCDGISKAYGRGVVEAGAFVTAMPGTYSSKNYFSKFGSRSFGNYYLQKFIQMIIPVPLGESGKITLPLLKGFEKNFSAYGEYENLIMDLFELPFSEISMRTKEEMIEFAQVTHQITLERMSAHGFGNVKPSLAVLCVELLDVFCQAIMRISLPIVQGDYEHGDDVAGLYRKPNPRFASLEIKCRDEFMNDSEEFSRCFFQMFKVEVWPVKKNVGKIDMVPRAYIPDIGLSDAKDEKFYFKISAPKAQVLWFYRHEDDKFEPKNGETPSEVDVKFVQAFRDTLKILTKTI